MIALDFELIFSEIYKGSKPNVSFSMSEKIGLAPELTTEFAVEIKVNDGTITSSPTPIEFAISDACSADVPEFNVKQ